MPLECKKPMLCVIRYPLHLCIYVLPDTLKLPNVTLGGEKCTASYMLSQADISRCIGTAPFAVTQRTIVFSLRFATEMRPQAPAKSPVVFHRKVRSWNTTQCWHSVCCHASAHHHHDLWKSWVPLPKLSLLCGPDLHFDRYLHVQLKCAIQFL